MKYCVAVNKNRDIDLSAANEVMDYIRKSGNEVCLYEEEEGKPFGETPKDCETVVVLGGDGTMIRTANKFLDQNVRFYGINIGNLGFLTDVEKENFKDGLSKVFSGEFKEEERMMLDVLCNGTYVDTVLNEVVICRKGSLKMLNLAIYVNGEWIDSIMGDGLIVSTPTGSTGYSLSAGGAVVHPEAKIILITPICPHSLASRPFVLSAEDEISIEFFESSRTLETEAMANLDGRVEKKLVPGDRVTIKHSEYKTKLIKTDKSSFFERVRKKLY